MKKEIRDKRFKLLKEGKKLQELSLNDCDFDNAIRIKEQQQEVYDKFKFYDEFIKANDKLKRK